MILKIPHNGAPIHFAGQLAFGPAHGRLYVAIGDAGGRFDPLPPSLDPASLLGKIFRIDVENGGAEPEIVAMGLRNPWRFSFDRENGDLYIGDVGEDDREEINFRSVPRTEPRFWMERYGGQSLPAGRSLGCNTAEPASGSDF